MPFNALVILYLVCGNRLVDIIPSLARSLPILPYFLLLGQHHLHHLIILFFMFSMILLLYLPYILSVILGCLFYISYIQ